MRFILLITCMAIVVTGIAMVHSFVLGDGSAQKSYLDIKTSDVLDSGAEVTTAADTSKAPSVTIVTSSSTSSAITHISTVPQTTTAVTTAKSTTAPQATTTATVASTTAATSTTPTSAYPRPPVGTMKPIDPEATYGYNAHDYLD